MINFFEHFDNPNKIMSSSTKTPSTISSSGSSSSASTNQTQPAGQLNTPTSIPALYTQLNNSTSCQSPSFNANGPGTPNLATSQVINNSNLICTPTTVTTNTNTSILHEEKVYKKEKQILVEFEAKTKGK